MDEDSGYEPVSGIELVDEEDIDTILEAPAPDAVQMRSGTASEWPPQPPQPAFDDESELPDFDDDDVPLALGSSPDLPQPVVPRRNAGFYAAVRRPTTSDPT
jgi:hypothetical protein